MPTARRINNHKLKRVVIMNIIGILNNKNVKSLGKREAVVEAINTGLITIEEIQSFQNVLDDKKMALVLEAMETVTNKNPGEADLDWLKFAQGYITSESKNLKRESSRIIGNISHLFPDDLEDAIQSLSKNTENEGTVIRWGSAYALGRIVAIPRYANSELFNLVTDLYERENDNGVKNQYLGGLKKAKKLRG